MGALFRDSLGYLVGRIANGVLAIAALSILPRLLGREGYGTYALWFAAVTMCSTVGFQWLAVSLSRFLAVHRDRPSALVRTATVLYWRTAACVVVLGVIVSPFVARTQVSTLATILVVAGTVGMGWQNVLLQLANALQRPAAFGMLTFSRAAVGLGIASLLVLAGFGSLGALAAIPLSCAAIAFVGRRVLHLPRDSNRTASATSLAELWRYGLPLSLTYVAATVIDLSDRFLLSWFKGPGAVAGYAVSYDLVQQVIGASMNVFFLAGFPRAVAAWESGDRSASLAAIQAVGRSIVLFGGLAIMIFYHLAPAICQVFFGAGVDQEAARVMPVIAVAITMATYRSFFLDAILQLGRRTRGQMHIMIIMAATNVLANLLLIPRFGSLGAAYGTLVAVIVGLVLTSFIARAIADSINLLRDLAVSCILIPLSVVIGISPQWLLGDGLLLLIVSVTSSLAFYLLVSTAVDHCGARVVWAQLRHRLY